MWKIACFGLLSIVILPLVVWGQGWNVELVGSINHWDLAMSVAVQGIYAYIAAGATGLRIVNIADQPAPYETGYLDTPNSTGSIKVSGDYAYLTMYGGGLGELCIVNITNPANPFETGHYYTPGLAEEVEISGNYAYVADYYSGLRILNIENPYSPYEAGYYDTPGISHNISVVGIYAYVADEDHFEILDCSEALFVYNLRQNSANSFSLRPYYPNPFNNTTAIPFTLDKALPVKITVYNNLGQEVEIVFKGTLPAGNHQQWWNAGGFSSGVYTVTLESPQKIQSQKVILIK